MHLIESRLMARRTFAGSKLTQDAARLLANDRASPPEARPCLMDVVRSLSEFIEKRACLGWTDPMIAALLTEAGYPITPGTLRSYRKRLRDNRARGKTPDEAGAVIATPLPDEAPGKLAAPSAAPSLADDQFDGLSPAAPSETPALMHPPGRPKPRSFAISRNNIPPDRA